MNNTEKAMELFPDTPTLECLCKGVREKLIEMAEWKDHQFKEYLEKKRDSISNYAQARMEAPIYNEIINELFKEEQKMKYYTETIPAALAEKLKEKGMPNIEGKDYFRKPSYAEVLDWLMERGWLVDIGRDYDFATEQVTDKLEWAIEKVGCFSSQPDKGSGWSNTWHEAANAAIEKALEMI